MRKRADDIRWKKQLQNMIKEAVKGNIPWQQVESEANKILDDLSLRRPDQDKNKVRLLYIEACKALILVEEAKGEPKSQNKIIQLYFNILEETHFKNITSLFFILRNAPQVLHQNHRMLARAYLINEYLNNPYNKKVKQCLIQLYMLTENINEKTAEKRLQVILANNPHGKRIRGPQASLKGAQPQLEL